MKIKVLCNVIHHGSAYGRKGDIIEVPHDIGRALIADKKAEEVRPAAPRKPAA